MTLTYLHQGLLDDQQHLRSDLTEPARKLAATWVKAGIDPALIEVISEVLARTAAYVRDPFADTHLLLPELHLLGPPELVREFLQAALGDHPSATVLAATACHLLDIAEAMAESVILPELPNMLLKADRSGDAAKQVGMARHLRG